MKVKVIDAATGAVEEVGPSEGTCMGCQEKPAVGIIFQLCDDCLIAFCDKVDAHYEKTGQRYDLSDQEFQAMNEPFCTRKHN